MFEAIKTRWFQLLEKVSANASGKVVLEFKLRPDGRITDMKMAQNEVTEELGTFCEQAIFDPAPFPPWPRQMRLDNPADSLDLQFTFYYDVE
jgi:outer membrane biosynthesis protein TonB